MAKIDLTKYGITGTTEIVYNPSYEMLFEEETKPGLEGFEKGQVSELGAGNYQIILLCKGRRNDKMEKTDYPTHRRKLWQIKLNVRTCWR